MSALTTFHADIKNILEQGICYTVCCKLSWSHLRLIEGGRMTRLAMAATDKESLIVQIQANDNSTTEEYSAVHVSE